MACEALVCYHDARLDNLGLANPACVYRLPPRARTAPGCRARPKGERMKLLLGLALGLIMGAVVGAVAVVAVQSMADSPPKTGTTRTAPGSGQTDVEITLRQAHL